MSGAQMMLLGGAAIFTPASLFGASDQGVAACMMAWLERGSDRRDQ